MHTNPTDGVATMQQMVAAARARGYGHCAIAPDGSLDWDDEFLAGFDIVVASCTRRCASPEGR